MSERVEAIYENGVFRPLDKVSIPEGQRVRLTFTATGEMKDSACNLGEIAEETGISDLAANIDHYLYGLPKAK